MVKTYTFTRSLSHVVDSGRKINLPVKVDEIFRNLATFTKPNLIRYRTNSGSLIEIPVQHWSEVARLLRLDVRDGRPTGGSAYEVLIALKKLLNENPTKYTDFELTVCY